MKKYNIYRNLHNNLLSIQDKVTKLVVGHCESVLLRNTSFKVNEAGIKRIRKKFKTIDPNFKAIETDFGRGYLWQKDN